MDKINNERLLDVPTQNDNGLSYREIRFIDEYMASGVATDAYMKAYPDATRTTAQSRSSTLLHREKVKSEIARRSAELTKSSIISTQEALELFSKIARGEEKDQFGLDASLKDRMSALNNLMKIQLEIEKAKESKQDNSIQIQLIR